ncbi:E3 UFM1-protein ligase 1 homolog isoform X7 [Panicum virgatum]|uniref:E3 UFM1-protein ligase 1 homolog isoform X7 n=1 Tax=Panicum virgatum TaxID=38727 RepID=UPI0019D6459C|nr:E3 UFM1-protein ligase 1 homolog isoform X7 [Panicum virgatum]
MDPELLELQRQLEAAQSARSSVRLSERNVVELVQKLQERGIIDFELLHTTSGKEYITSDHLKHEIKMEIKKQGRASLVDLSDTLGVDLYHVERQSQKVVSDDPTLMLINGEIMSQSYWNTVTEEINEKLQERSQIALAEIAAQLHIGSELVISILEPRLGTIVKGRLEGGQLYTPAYVSRITAMVRGAARGTTVPTNLPSVWNSLQQQLQEMHGASGVSVEGSFFQSIFNGLLKEGAVLGSIRAGGQWTPAVFAHAQKESVDAFFSQNSYIGYDVLQKLAIPQPKQYLEARYPDGIALDAVFVHPSVVDMLDTAVGDAIDNGHWIDSLSVLPSYITGPDATRILSICPSLQKAIKSSKAVLFGESCVFSNVFIKKRNTMLSGNAERRRRLLDNLQKQIDEAVLDMQLYEKALDVFEDDPATSGILHKHLLKSMGTPIVDKVLITLDKDRKLKNGMEVEDSEDEHVQLSTADRTSLVKDLPGALSLKAQALIEALEGKRFNSFMDALRDILEESGLTFKKLDKRLERTMLHSYRKDLTAQVSSESDPVSFLPKVVALLFLQAYNKALQAPGRAVGAVIALLKKHRALHHVPEKDREPDHQTTHLLHLQHQWNRQHFLTHAQQDTMRPRLPTSLCFRTFCSRISCQLQPTRYWLIITALQ